MRRRNPMTEDRRMELVIPAGVQVHITIGRTPLLALPDEIARERPPARPSRPLLKGVLALVLLFGAFEVGRHVAAWPDTTGPTRAAFAMPGQAPALGPEQHAFPDRPLPREAVAAGAPAQQIPPEFRQQLEQPPSVIPPPGQTPPGAAPEKNPFGLEN
jgi:hypothetical protein